MVSAWFVKVIFKKVFSKPWFMIKKQQFFNCGVFVKDANFFWGFFGIL